MPPAVRIGHCPGLNDCVGAFLKMQKGLSEKVWVWTWQRGLEEGIHSIQKEMHRCRGRE